MDDQIRKIQTPEKCEIFANNARRKGREDLANKAIAWAVELKAESFGARTQAEREAIQAIYAYEETLRLKNGKKTRATRTWQMIDRHGIIETVNRAVNRPVETQGYRGLLDKGLEMFAFEAVVLRHPNVFSPGAYAIAKKRMEEWASTSTLVRL